MTKDKALDYLKNKLSYEELGLLIDEKSNLQSTRGMSRLWLELHALLSLSEITIEWNKRRHNKQESA